MPTAICFVPVSMPTALILLSTSSLAANAPIPADYSSSYVMQCYVM